MGGAADSAAKVARPTPAQRRYLLRGVDQPGGKLPLFDEAGQRISGQTVQSCIKAGWAEPWFPNPIKPDWLVCKLTPAGRAVLRWHSR
jgi:hypothetical protein